MFMHFPSRHPPVTSWKPQKGRQGAAKGEQNTAKYCTVQRAQNATKFAQKNTAQGEKDAAKFAKKSTRSRRGAQNATKFAQKVQCKVNKTLQNLQKNYKEP